jgi:hypothetical protein
MKSFALTVISNLLILLTINLGYYYDWVRARPVSYWSDFLKEKDDTLDIEGIIVITGTPCISTPTSKHPSPRYSITIPEWKASGSIRPTPRGSISWSASRKKAWPWSPSGLRNNGRQS